MPGRYHISISLPGGVVAVADYRDPITDRMHAMARARELGKPPDPDDIEAVTAWLDANEAQVAVCARGECHHEP